MRTVLTAERLYDGTGLLDHPVVVIRMGESLQFIAFEGEESASAKTHVWTIPAPRWPGFFDVHIHGAAGHDVMEATRA